MKNKVLIFSIPALLTVFLLVGFGIGSNLWSDLSSDPDNGGIVMTPMATGDSCFGTGQELHDDRSFESGGGWNATALDGRIAVKFRPASYPWKYNKVCVPLTKNAGADSLVYDILIYDSTGVGGGPGVVRDSVIGIVARTIPTFAVYAWYATDISSRNGTLVNSGCIWICIRWNASINSAAGKFMSYDNSATTPIWPTMYSANGAAFADAIGAWPTYRAFGMRTMGSTPVVPAGDSTLVMFHDTTVTGGLAKRMADRDSVMKYLPSKISKYRTMYFSAVTTMPDLTNYGTILLVETSFDNSGALVLGAAARTSIRTWLATGTVSSKKTLISIGGDQGYNYDRTGGSGLDTAFSRGTCGFIYRVDSGMPSPGTITGVLADIGNTRTIVSPSDAGYYPDGCSPTNGGLTLYKYGNHSILDTLAGISRITTGYNVLTSFQDPRYFTGGNVSPWLTALLNYAKLNGATVTNATPISSIIADKYSLSQNYPNPFNPTTKISFMIPANGFVSLKVYNITGQEVMTLVNENMHTGAYSVDFNGAFLSSGVYFYRLESANFVETKKMMLVK